MSAGPGTTLADEASAPPGEVTLPGPRVRAWRRMAPLAFVLVLLGGLAGWMLYANGGVNEELYARQATAFENATGIRLVRVVMTAGGGIVELHYQVLDPDKAVGVHDDEAPPGLIDESSGAIIAVPFHDHSFRELHTAVTYREMFMNGGGALHRGSHVTLVVGDARIEHIEVG